MAHIADIKELACAETPLFLLDCTLKSGDAYHWSTHAVTVNNIPYDARILQHNIFEMKSSSENATDGISSVSVTLANADALLSPIERNIGWKGAKVTVTFLFYSLATAAPASDTRVVFRGIANAPDESTETGLKLTFSNRLNLQRIYLPETQISKNCPWMFPADGGQRQEALTGAMLGKFSPAYRCGYSADISGGVGNLNGSVPYTTCDYTRAQCVQRGMFSTDTVQNTTARFGGIEFVPPSIIVRTYRDKSSHVSTTLDNQANYNDPVPLIYGTGWYQPPIVFARNDGNLTRMEVLLGEGEMTSVLKVIVNNIEIPLGVSGTNMTATGWYNVVSHGTRNGAFNYNFTDANGAPLGDPYGSMAYMSVVVPNAINNGTSLPAIQVLVQGLKLSPYDATGTYLGNDVYTNNPVWVLLDVLRRSGWTLGELDVPSFANAAAICATPKQTTDLNGNATQIPRYQCNLLLTRRQSASDVVRGIRNGSGLFLNFDSEGLLQVTVEDTLAAQQPTKPDGSNSESTLNGGWPAYEFGDSSLSGIALRSNGQSSLRVYSRTSADTPNCFAVEFQDEFNEYQQDSYSLLDQDDRTMMGQEITASLPVLGVPNYDQATRIAYLFLSKSLYGNTYVDFQTSVKSVTLSPGDIIALTYAREGFSRQPFRIVRIAPGSNYRQALITGQWHDDEWYSASAAASAGSGRQGIANITAPRPLIGTVLNADGSTSFGITETLTADSDGSNSVQLAAAFMVPATPSTSAVSIPLVSLEPLYSNTGGTIGGGTTFYYAVSAIDSSAAESGLSFSILATTPDGTSTNSITLQNLSFSSAAKGFNVYRGPTPANLLQIASNAAISALFTDPGLTAALQGPPDANFDHANFYWRFVVRPQQKSDIQGPNTIGVSTAGMQTNEFRGSIARITSGTGAAQERTIISNTDSTVSVAPSWDIQPDATSEFLIADASWLFGATSSSSPVTFTVPNRTGAVVQISGRAANVHDDECAYELSPLTTWQILGGSGSTLDQDVPGQPSFGMYAVGQGAIEVVGIGFSDLANTHGVTAGTLSLVYWDEVAGPAPVPLANGMVATDQSLTLNTAVSAQAGDIFQVESELMTVQQAVNSGTSVNVSRGAYGTSVATHGIGVGVYALARKTFVMPFPLQFFGTSSSGSYSYRVLFPDVRIAGADFFVTNSQGNSADFQRAFTSTVGGGLRTLSGGQVSIQIDGPLAMQTSAVPPLIMDTAHSVRDVTANVGTAPSGGPINLQITQNGQPYCQLSIPDGATASPSTAGTSLPILLAQGQIGIDVLAVPTAVGTSPGADLTVTIRL